MGIKGDLRFLWLVWQKELNKNLLQAQLEKITRNYDHYIKKEMMANDSIPGEDKIINIVKKEYFVNNT